MKALVYEGPKQVAVRDVAKPVPQEGQALLRVEYCGICGSDIGIYGGTHPRAKAPLVMGHEFMGVIEEIRGESNGFQVGDRVAPYPLLSCGKCFACRNGREHVCDTLKIIGIDLDGGVAEYVCCNTDVLYKVPDRLPSKIAGIIEPLAVAVHTIHRAGFKPLDRVAIQGAGPIGALVGIMAKHSGAAQIIISDMDDSRLEMGRSLGFETVDLRSQNFTEYVRKATNGDGADIVFECTGAESAALEMTGACRTDGMICLVGVHKAPHPVALADMHFRELNMTATRVYTKRDFQQAVNLTVEVADDLDKLISHVLPLSDCANVFELIHDPKVPTVKVVVDCTK
ncbi:MAG: zinc-dependent alcohol dehydrogenase [Lawsonibacter sp.]|jgi:2-desacetyl-2-hydroxyethyl bacteriochlorophyllide A dehydrogenase